MIREYAAFLQNAGIWGAVYPGFHPGLVCVAPLGQSEQRSYHLYLLRGEGKITEDGLFPRLIKVPHIIPGTHRDKNTNHFRTPTG